ncbi:MAG: 3-hydroxyacyl-ACP dehydratase FabZ [Rhodobacterales bacterium]
MTEQNSDETISVDLAMIQRMIPHRYPFLFIDKVKGIVASERAVGIKNVTFNEPHFQGHFPAKPIMPGVTVIEAMAQTAAVLVSYTLDLVDKNPLVYFMTMDKCRFRNMVVPGDVLELHVQVLRGRGKIWKFWGEGKVNGKIVTEAEFAAMIDLPKGVL